MVSVSCSGWSWPGTGSIREGGRDTGQQVAWGCSMSQRTAGTVFKDFTDGNLTTPMTFSTLPSPSAPYSRFTGFGGRSVAHLCATAQGKMAISLEDELYKGTNLIHINRKALCCLRRVLVGAWLTVSGDPLERSCHSGPYLFQASLVLA